MLGETNENAVTHPLSPPGFSGINLMVGEEQGATRLATSKIDDPLLRQAEGHVRTQLGFHVVSATNEKLSGVDPVSDGQLSPAKFREKLM